MSNGWNESAAAWIAEVGDLGDFGRRFVLDQPMLERVRLRAHGSALDVGCGEGRFCRMLQPLGIRTVGIDPTEALLARAIALDPMGDYRVGMAERLDFEDQCFDLVVEESPSKALSPDGGAARLVRRVAGGCQAS